MALVLADRVKETTTTTGTGTYTLAGAADSSFETFASIGNGNTTYYACTDGSDFEVGIGTYTASGTTLARTTILQSSNSDNAVNWGAGTKDIFCTQPAEKAVFRDASGHIIALDGRNLTNVDAATLDSIDSSSFLRSDAADTKTSGDLTFNDSIKAKFGSDSDFQVYHNGTNGYLQESTNAIIYRSAIHSFRNSADTEQLARFDQNGDVELYYDNSKKFITSASGAKTFGQHFIENTDGYGALEVGGTSGGFVDLKSPNSDDYDIRLITTGTGGQFLSQNALRIGSSGTTSITNVSGNSTYANFIPSGAVELFHSGNKKFETSSTGATLTGQLVATSLDISGDVDVDGTLEADAITLNGTALASSATTDTTNASNISSGTLPNARLDAQLQDVAGLAVTNGNFIVGDGSNFVAESGATARTSLGLGTAATLDTGISNTNVPKFTSGVADNDFLKVAGTAIEGRSASEVLSDIGGITASSTDTLTNKTLTNPTINAFSGTGDASITGDLTLISTDGGSAVDPFLKILRNSSSPANQDVLGGLSFQGKNNNSEFINYAFVQSRIRDVTDGSENGALETFVETDGSLDLYTVHQDGQSQFYKDVALISSDAGATENPTLDLYRNSASPADGDVLGHIAFNGENSADEKTKYAEIEAKIIDVTDGTEDGKLDIRVMSGGADSLRVSFQGNAKTKFVNRDVEIGSGINLLFEGSSDDANETTLTVVNPTTDRTITLPDATGTVLLTDGDGSSLTNVNATTLDSVDSTSFLRSDAADTKTSGNLQFSDNVRLRLGSSGSSDLQIWHDGTNSNIVNGTGDLIIGDSTGDVKIQGKYGEQSIIANNDGSVELYHDNSKKLETASGGISVTGEIAATSLDISGDVDVDGTLEADAITLNGTSLAASATTDTTNASNISSGTLPNARLDAQLQDVAGLAVTNGGFIVGDGSNFVLETGSTARASLELGTAAVLDTGISNTNVPKFTSGVADNDFLRVDGTSIEGRSASEVLSDIGGQAALTFGISNTNAVKIDSTSVADNEFARFTANGLESRSASEVLSDIGAITASSTDTLTNKTINASQLSGTIANARLDQQLQDVAGLAVTNGNFIVGDGSNFVAESGSTARDSLSLGTSSDVQFDSFGVGTAASGTTGEIRATADITSNYSDERLKNIHGTIPNALDKVKSLGGYYFTENEIAKSLGYDNDAQQVGVIAQEVEKVLPEAVKPAPIDDKYLTVQYEKMVPLLIEAMKEQQAKIEELESRLAKLEA